MSPHGIGVCCPPADSALSLSRAIRLYSIPSKHFSLKIEALSKIKPGARPREGLSHGAGPVASPPSQGCVTGNNGGTCPWPPMSLCPQRRCRELLAGQPVAPVGGSKLFQKVPRDQAVAAEEKGDAELGPELVEGEGSPHPF